ncbi:MAG: DUF99 family protein [bacterium]|nr:DUF99 family protein [bacterium]
MAKKEIRILGIDDAPFDKFKDKKTLIVGTFFRGGSFLDGVLSSPVTIDGTDSTNKIIKMVKKCRFYPQLQAIMLDGIAVGGFNIIDVQRLNKTTKIPVIVVVRHAPDLDRIKKVLIKLGKKSRIKLIERAGKIKKINNVYVQLTGIDEKKAKAFLDVACTRSFLPEPVRTAHIIASGVTYGESRGKP